MFVSKSLQRRQKGDCSPFHNNTNYFLTIHCNSLFPLIPRSSTLLTVNVRLEFIMVITQTIVVLRAVSSCKVLDKNLLQPSRQNSKY
jgi:hypothetical protein